MDVDSSSQELRIHFKLFRAYLRTGEGNEGNLRFRHSIHSRDELEGLVTPGGGGS